MRVSADTFTFRAGRPTDAHFLLSTWLKSYRNSGPVTKIPNANYFQGHQDLIVHILSLQGTAVEVVCAKDDPDQIIGYVVYNKLAPILHYVYVKYPFRKLGLGTMLISIIKEHHKSSGLPLHCTHIARQWDVISRKMGLIFDPYNLGVTYGQQTPQLPEQAHLPAEDSTALVPELVPGTDQLHQ
jgi:hypothetical protein